MFEGIDFQGTLRAAQQGDGAALNLLLERCYPAVQRSVHRSLASSTRRNRPWLVPLFSTGDVVQEVFVSVVRDVDSLKDVTESTFVGFLASLVRNRLVDSIRFHEAMRRGGRRVRDLDPGAAGDAGGESPPAAAARAEEVENFCRVLAGTPARERALLVDRIQHEHAFARIATDLGYPSEDAARKAFYTAQARLVVRLRQAGITPQEPS
jgi:RNA polymerase sigma factor (sigma-70 family)